ncbi:MAG: 50S ribosomal protein L11 methyltransferase [Eubacteriales bacterium]|nr:50S ribosomal protein L11 methyltransferase [Eubacteriales bacterium]
MNNWTEVTIWTSTAGVDAVTGMLMDLGIDGFVIEDAQDFADFLQDTELYWDYVDETLAKEKQNAETNIKIYVEDSPAGAELLAQVNTGLAGLRARDAEHVFGRCTTELAAIKQEDWENNWKQYFKPFRVGETFLIKPSWEQCEPEEGRRILEIDPSSSFGTGTHNTTQLCICELERLVKPCDRLLDMGCGSGILSVAAHMLGAEDITAVDIDPNATRIAAENAEKNGFSLRTYVGDVIGDEALAQEIGSGYDIIVANIVADVIMGMQDILKSKLKADGTLIVSGIIAPRADEVQQSLLEEGFVLERRDQSGDWVAMTLHQL